MQKVKILIIDNSLIIFIKLTFRGLPWTPGDPTDFRSGVFCILGGSEAPAIVGPVGGAPC